MNAIDYLLKEHDSHRKLMEEIETDKSLYSTFREELIHHVNMEESILYPNLLRVPDLEETVREAWEEHGLIMQLVQEMDDSKLDPKDWLSKFHTLKKLLLIHLKDEEIKIFPKIRSMASAQFLEDVGEQMLIQKETVDTEKIIYPN